MIHNFTNWLVNLRFTFVFKFLEDAVDTGAGGSGVITLNGTDSSSTNAGEYLITESVYLYNSFILLF